MLRIFSLILLLMPLFTFGQVWKAGNGFKHTSYYKKPGSLILHFNNFMFSGKKTATPPVNFVPQVTIAKNLSAGPIFTYFQFRHSEFEAINSTRWVDPGKKYHEVMAGLKAEYHINDFVESLINRKLPQHFLDLYVTTWGGYSWAWSKAEDANEALIESHEKMQCGAAIGARSLVLPRMGFSLEGGYSTYGYCSFGLFVWLH